MIHLGGRGEDEKAQRRHAAILREQAEGFKQFEDGRGRNGTASQPVAVSMCKLRCCQQFLRLGDTIPCQV